MRRRPAPPRRFFNHFNHFIRWGFYYTAILVGGILPFPSRPPFVFTALGLPSAAPILLIGLPTLSIALNAH